MDSFHPQSTSPSAPQLCTSPISHTHAGASGHTVHINSMAVVMNKFVLLCRHIILCDLVDLKQMPSPSPLLHVHVAVVLHVKLYTTSGNCKYLQLTLQRSSLQLPAAAAGSVAYTGSGVYIYSCRPGHFHMQSDIYSCRPGHGFGCNI